MRTILCLIAMLALHACEDNSCGDDVVEYTCDESGECTCDAGGEICDPDVDDETGCAQLCSDCVGDE